MAGGGLVLQRFLQSFSSNGSWTAPNNLALPPAVFCWGPAGPAAAGSAGGSGGGGGGGGSLGSERALGGVAPGTVLTVAVGTVASATATTVTGGSVTVTGNPGGAASGSGGGSAGAASGNTVAFAGGAGGNGFIGASGGGGGGGGSGGSGGAGGNGGNGTASAAGAAGSAGAGSPGTPGAAGGIGGSTAGGAGGNGVFPGGAAGGGGNSGSVGGAAGTSRNGQAQIVYYTFAVQLAPIPRRVLSRAGVQFTPVTTTNAAASGTVQPLATVPVPRRRPARAGVQFTPVTTTNAAAPVVPVGPPPVIPTSGGDRGVTIRVFREIRPGDVPAAGAQLPRLTGRAFAMPVPADTEHAIHAWEAEPEPPEPDGPTLLEQVRAELDDLAAAARDLADAAAETAARTRPHVERAGRTAYSIGKIFGTQPYDPRPRKVCGATRMSGGVVLTCQRKPHDDGWHTDKGLHWR